MAILASTIITEASKIFGDTDKVRATDTDWIGYLNSAVRALILHRPDAGAFNGTLQLAAGTRQALPADALRLIEIYRNMGSSGSAPGKIIYPSDRKHIDFSNLLWHIGSGATYVDNYSYDKENPQIFYVTPPVHTTTPVFVELAYAKLPVVITVGTQEIPVNNIFYEPLLAYMLYKVWSIDDEDVNFQKGQAQLSLFFSLIGAELQQSRAIGPERRE
jgi:hypothetical protein